MKISVAETMTNEEKLWQMKEALLKADEQCRPQTALYNKNGTPELMTVLGPDGSVSDIVKGDIGEVSASIEKGSIVLHTHPMSSNVRRETGKWTYSSSALGPSGQDIQSAKDAQSTVLALDCASGTILGVDANGNAVEVYLDAEKKTATIRSLANEKRSQQLDLDDKSSINREYSQDIADKRLKKYETEVSSQAQQQNSNGEVLHSLANLLETGEEFVEVRQDMREKRHERKAKEQAERERKAAEEAERLRQQQIEEQRKKKDAQKKKKSDKKTSGVGGAMSTPTTQQGRSAGTNPASGTEPANTDSQIGAQQPAQPTVTIDFSPLDNCTSILNSSKNLIGSLAASMVEVAMSKGEEEYSKLKTQIASLPDGDRKQQLEQALEAKYAAFKEAKSYYE